MGSPYTDDPVAIPPGSLLIRRIAPAFVDWSTLDEHGRPRITRQAVQFYNETLAAKFECPGPAMSVIVEYLADPIDVLAQRYAGEGLAYLNADLVRGDDNERGIQPWQRDDELAHAAVFRTDGGRDLPGSVKQRFAEYMTAHWIMIPLRS